MSIDYVKLANEIAKNTPEPTTAGEWSIFGLMIAILIITNIASWIYFLWEKKQTLALQNKTTETMVKVNSTMDKLMIYFEQNHVKEDVNSIKTEIALINQKLK